MKLEEAQLATLPDRFDVLQSKLRNLWPTISKLNNQEQTIVVIPSQSVEFDCEGSEMQAYEERFLFLLLLLRQPRARLVYVTSRDIPTDVIDYYLALLPGVIPSHARERLFMISVGDPAPTPLTPKILSRPRLIQRIRSLIIDPDKAHLVHYNTTEDEKKLALQLGIPMFGCDPVHAPLGTKTGGRQIFSEAQIRYPLGFEDLRNLDEIIDAIQKLKSQRPTCSAAMVKLNEGISGEGNAVANLEGISENSSRTELMDCVRNMQLELQTESFDGFISKFESAHGIVEERIIAKEVRSPSVQLRINPLGEVELLSTHDQLLGGPTGQSYTGCVFPADEGYAAAISENAIKIGKVLAERGALGRFAVDFLVANNSDAWDVYAIELNLRKGGTTHPFLTLQFLTDGEYDWQNNCFLTPRGRRKCLVASDHVESQALRTLNFRELFDIVVRHQIHFDHARQTGIVMHMLASLGECGRFGITAVGDSPEDARQKYEDAITIFMNEAHQAAMVNGPDES